MHTLAKNAVHNERLIEDFMKKAYEGREPTITELIRDNIINGTQLIEQAVSRVEGIGLCPVGDHRDLIDDSDVKTTTVQKVTSKVWKVLKDGKKKRYITTSYSCIIQDVFLSEESHIV